MSWKRRIIVFFIFLGVSVLAMLSIVWPAVGNAPTDADLEAYHGRI